MRVGTGVGDEIHGRRGAFVLGPPSKITGLHAMCVIGVRWLNGQRLYTIVQSYGAAYGINGLFEVTDEYLAWHMTSDLLIVDDWEALRDARAA